MKTDKQTPAVFINAMLERHGIPLEAIYHYALAHEEEINGMKRIFDLKTINDAQCFLTIPSLFFQNDAGRIIKFVKGEDPGNKILAEAGPDAAKYALPLMTAFVYTRGFFAMSWNWCAYARAKAQAETRQEPGPPIARVTPARRGWTKHRDCSYRFEYKAASAAVPGFRKFGASLEIEEGTLETLGVKIDGYYLQFRFTPKPEANVPHSCTPNVRFTTPDGQAVHTLRLRHRDDTGIMYSDPKDGKDIDYTQGIIIQSVEFTEAEEGGNG